MKLKSKLIATIVSICAAIAVMGIGVWAATDSFTVTVTNTVNISVSTLSGTITATATAIKEGGTDFEADEFEDVEIYNSAATGENAHLADNNAAIGVTGEGVEHAWNGAGLFDGQIDSETTSAVLTYTFVYTPAGDASGNITVAITNVSVPTCEGATLAYSYTINGEGGELTAAGVTADPIEASAEPITVVVIATYTNTNLVSAKASGSFNFSLSFKAVA